MRGSTEVCPSARTWLRLGISTAEPIMAVDTSHATWAPMIIDALDMFIESGHVSALREQDLTGNPRCIAGPALPGAL